MNKILSLITAIVITWSSANALELLSAKDASLATKQSTQKFIEDNKKDKKYQSVKKGILNYINSGIIETASAGYYNVLSINWGYLTSIKTAENTEYKNLSEVQKDYILVEIEEKLTQKGYNIKKRYDNNGLASRLVISW